MSALSPQDREALADALRKALQDGYGFSTGRRLSLAAGPAEMPSAWRLLGELGLGGLLLPEAQGGVGAGPADLQRVQRELGRALVVAPWLDTVLGAQAVRLVGTPAQQAALLPAVAAGESSFALASLREDATAPVRARVVGSEWHLQGHAAHVAHAGAVQRLLVTAIEPGGGRAWFVVTPSPAGVPMRHSRMVDGSWAADLVFEDVPAERLGGSDPAPHDESMDDLDRLALAARCAESLGAAEAALEQTVQHLRSRRQFGQPLGEYQALRHRVAEMAIALEQARSAAELALEAAEEPDAALARRRAAQAQLVSSDSVTWILQQAIQLHGGMGMTEDLPVGHHYRRQLVVDALSGGAQAALARLVRQV